MSTETKTNPVFFWGIFAFSTYCAVELVIFAATLSPSTLWSNWIQYLVLGAFGGLGFLNVKNFILANIQIIKNNKNEQT